MSAPELPKTISPIEDAVSLHRQGRFDEAEKIYNRILKMRRDDFDALHLLGLLHHQRGRPGEAYRLIASALKINPRSADALANMGLALHALKRSPEALASFDKALALAPDHLDAINNRGIVLLETQRPAEALAAFDQVLEGQPAHVQARINRANALAQLDRAAEAVAEYDAALAAAPGHPHALYNKGNALRMLGHEDDAIAAYDGALAVVPGHLGAWQNRGLALAALNCHEEALESYRKALAIEPEHPDVNFNEALALLTLGDYRQGFRKYEWRWKRSGMNARPRFRQRLWLGEYPLAGKTILLHAEQGLGDTIQFARYAPLLARDGAKVVIEVPPELKPLLSGLAGVSAVVGRGEPLPHADVQCPLASLPLACKTEPGSIPSEIPYLRADEERTAHWRERLATPAGRRIAIAWSGRPTHVNDRNRSISLAALEPLLAMPGIDFVSIQRDVRSGDADRLAADSRITHLGGDLADFSDTAAVLELCDLTISVDTSVAHLAAAMGRPTFVLLPFQADWRWTVNGDHSPWYPQARLFRQYAPGDWNSVLQRVREELASARSPAT